MYYTTYFFSKSHITGNSNIKYKLKVNISQMTLTLVGIIR